MGYDLYPKKLNSLALSSFYLVDELLEIIKVLMNCAELCGSNGELGSMSYIFEEKKWTTKRRGEKHKQQQQQQQKDKDGEASVL